MLLSQAQKAGPDTLAASWEQVHVTSVATLGILVAALCPETRGAALADSEVVRTWGSRPGLYAGRSQTPVFRRVSAPLLGAGGKGALWKRVGVTPLGLMATYG